MSTPTRGATASAVSFRHRFDNYLDHHRAIAKDSWQRLLKTPMASLMTIMVIAIALTLPASLFVLMQNVKAVSGEWGGQAQLSLFLKINTFLSMFYVYFFVYSFVFHLMGLN